MPLLPSDVEEYNLDSHSVRFVNGVTVTVSRDGAVGVGESRISERDAFEKALADLESKDSEEPSADDGSEEPSVDGPESVGTEVEVNPSEQPFDFGALGDDTL